MRAYRSQWFPEVWTQLALPRIGDREDPDRWSFAVVSLDRHGRVPLPGPEAVLAAMVEAARAEPGVEVYSYCRCEDNRFWFFALMADDAPPQMSVTTPVAAIGLDL